MLVHNFSTPSTPVCGESLEHWIDDVISIIQFKPEATSFWSSVAARWLWEAEEGQWLWPQQ